MTDEELVEEIIEMLNGTDSPTGVYAFRETLISEFQSVLDMYWEIKETLDEIKSRIS